VVELTGFTHGAEAVGRLPDGRACFVAYGLPGERVRVRVIDQRKRWARAELLEVLDASPDRITPPCPYAGPFPAPGHGRCGGCALQHAAFAAQGELKRRVVVEQLQRIGGLPDPPVEPTVQLEPFAYRNSARFAVDPLGRLGFRALRSSAIVPIDRCPLLAGPVQAARDAAGDAWQGASEVTVRAALAGDDRRGVAVVTPAGEGGLQAPTGDLPVALVSAGGRSAALRGDATVVERVGGFDYRISPTSFFQGSTTGAEVLARLVREAARVTVGDTALDLYAGVGLFALPLAADGARVTAVEAHPSACDDARHNLARTDAEVVQDDAEAAVARMVEAWATTDVVVLDPPRRGAGAALCALLARLEPRVVVYVSCDPAALARDARALVDAGLGLVRAVPVDQFAQTAHIETVATFA
jgi:tRNA/tmRNA/rRNA uracil-C5-methylase (TrmA/RlmC/RlmD family)